MIMKSYIKRLSVAQTYTFPHSPRFLTKLRLLPRVLVTNSLRPIPIVSCSLAYTLAQRRLLVRRAGKCELRFCGIIAIRTIRSVCRGRVTSNHLYHTHEYHILRHRTNFRSSWRKSDFGSGSASSAVASGIICELSDFGETVRSWCVHHQHILRHPAKFRPI